jgi:very-short-patch-repair endonuclease
MQPRLSIPRSRALRSASTEAETALWRHLRNRLLAGYKFRRQVPVGAFIADFACESARLVVEIDGGQHLERTEHDAERTRVLQLNGYNVVRFWNDDALKHTEAVLEEILRALQSRSCPIPLAGKNPMHDAPRD